MSTAKRSVLTIGHSNHPIDHFVGLLRRHGVEVLVDARSYPYSKFAPQLDMPALKAAIQRSDMKYLFLGRELGGRPNGDEFYDSEGHVLYGRVAEAPFFREGLERLLRGVQTYRVALLCSEENPLHCHRRLLVGRVLGKHGVAVEHIRGDGNLQTEEALAAMEPRVCSAQTPLFEGSRETEWRSTQSVLHRGRLPHSSRP